MTAELVAQHTNSEGEEVTIERVTAGAFAGRLILVIHDDPPLGGKAPMLLDVGTRDWLLSVLVGSVTYEQGGTAFKGPVPLMAPDQGVRGG